MALSERDAQRFGRHLSLAEVGSRGQERLLASTVAVEGDGAAGEECARYLDAAGVRRAEVTSGGEPDYKARVPGERRLDGAWAALRALVMRSGAGDPTGWPESEEIGWHRG